MNEEQDKSQPRLHIKIDPGGNIVLETVDCRGKECDWLSGDLEASLGVITGRTNKDCYEQD